MGSARRSWRPTSPATAWTTSPSACRTRISPTLANAGLLHVVPGSAGTGLTNSGDQIWTQVLSPPEEGDQFGAALAAGRFAGNPSGGGVDLAIGVPFESVGAEVEAGAVNVLYSLTLFRDGFESESTAQWSATVP